jgi:hypothetical protein
MGVQAGESRRVDTRRGVVIWEMPRPVALQLVDFLRDYVPQRDGFRDDLDDLERLANEIRT